MKSNVEQQTILEIKCQAEEDIQYCPFRECDDTKSTLKACALLTVDIFCCLMLSSKTQNMAPVKEKWA